MTWYENPVLMATRLVFGIEAATSTVEAASMMLSLLVLLPVIDELGTDGGSETEAPVVVLLTILFDIEVLQESYLSIVLLFISGHKILEMPRESFIMYSLRDQRALTTLPFC